MTTHYSIHARPVRVIGDQRSGWRAATDSDSSARELPFEFSITDDGAGQFLLLCRSADGSLYGDNWHETLDKVFEAAKQEYGISRQEWADA